MVVAQGVKEAEITELDSLLLTKNLLRIAIFNISYIRGLFPEKYFNDKAVPALDMKIKKLMPVDAESHRLIDWMEKGVYDALQKKYLKTLLFCVCEANAGPVIEEYAFSFSYPDGQEVSMNVSRSGSKKGGAFQQNSTNEISSSQMRSSACKMIRTLVQLMRTLDKMPEERSIVMKLLYYENTPADYEPPFFRGCTEEEAHNPWTKNPLKMEVGNVNSKHVILTLKVKSVLDPCEDEDDNHDNMSLDGHSVDGDIDSDSVTEISMPDEDQYIVAPADEQQNPDNSPVVNEDDTQDPEEDEQRLTRVRDWIKSCHLSTINFTDVLSHFPDISVDGIIVTFYVPVDLLMQKLLKRCCQLKFLDYHGMGFSCKGQRVQVRRTMDELHMLEGDQIDAFARVYPGVRDERRRIHMSNAGLDGITVTFYVPVDPLMQKLLKRCCQLKFLDYHGMGFSCKGRRAQVRRTVDELHMVEGDQIDALVRVYPGVRGERRRIHMRIAGLQKELKQLLAAGDGTKAISLDNKDAILAADVLDDDNDVNAGNLEEDDNGEDEDGNGEEEQDTDDNGKEELVEDEDNSWEDEDEGEEQDEDEDGGDEQDGDVPVVCCKLEFWKATAMINHNKIIHRTWVDTPTKMQNNCCLRCRKAFPSRVFMLIHKPTCRVPPGYNNMKPNMSPNPNSKRGKAKAKAKRKG